MSKTLFQGVTVLTGDSLTPTQGDVLVEEGRIRKIGRVTPEEAAGAERFASGAHFVLLPGYVNAHTHAAMSLLRDYGGGQALKPWLEDYIWPAEAKLTDEDVYWGTQLGILEMLASGTTCFADHYDHCDAIAQAVAESGMRALITRGAIGMNDPAHRSIAEGDAVFARWHGAAEDRIRVWFGPHATNTCPGDYIQEMAAHARARGVGLHIHVAETKAELELIRRETGLTPMAWLERLGVLDVPVLAAHGVWLSEADIALCARRGVAIAHNPASNLKLASGLCDVPALSRAGVTVGLGTDGPSSNNIMSMHREVQLAALIHTLHALDPLALGPQEALSMATLGSARALRWEAEIGSIEAGKRADLTLYKLDRPWNAPHHDVVSNLVYAAQQGDIDSVFVDGRCLYKHGTYTTLDAERILYEAEVRARRITAP